MNIRTRTRRTTACLTLLLLPFALGGRFVLDLESDLTRPHTLEAEHGQTCPPFHDHVLCIHLFRSPWSPQTSSAAVPDLTAILADELPDLSGARPGGKTPPRIARGPPTRI